MLICMLANVCNSNEILIVYSILVNIYSAGQSLSSIYILYDMYAVLISLVGTPCPHLFSLHNIFLVYVIFHSVNA